MKVRRGVAEVVGRRAAYVVLLALSALVTSVEQLLVLRVGIGLFGGIGPLGLAMDQGEVVGMVDLAHAALADPLDDAVTTGEDFSRLEAGVAKLGGAARGAAGWGAVRRAGPGTRANRVPTGWAKPASRRDGTCAGRAIHVPSKPWLSIDPPLRYP